MSTIVRHNVDELPPSSRHNLEQLLGKRLGSCDRVYIIVEAPLESRRRTEMKVFAQPLTGGL
jgi:hypothetical protein